ncbi:MAG: DUF885 domain-containing protein [Steroidobacteraceae bacterium]
MSQVLRHIRAWWLLAALLPTFALAQSGSSDAAFHALADEFIDTFVSPASPTWATQNGIHTFDDKLEDYSRAAIKRHTATLKQYEARFSAIAAAKLSAPAAIDRELLLNWIRSGILSNETIRGWEKNPDSYTSGITGTAFAMISKQFAPPADRLRNLIAREKLMPQALEDARANLRNPPKIFTEIAIEQLPGMISFFDKDVVSAFADVQDPTLLAQFAASNGAVIKALNDYLVWLKADLLPRSHGDYKLGAATYAKKLQYDEMVTTPLPQLLEINLRNLRQNQADFARIAKELEPDKTTAQVLAELSADYPPPDKLLDTFRGTLDGLVKFINEHRIVTIPSPVRPIIEETPPFLRAITFASMDTPGPFEKVAKEAYFNVTLPDPKLTPEQTREFMAQFNYPVINGVAVHEAYPGHYVQFLVMHDVPGRVRKLFGAASNSEGWAHYCEQMMLDEGLAQALFPNDVRRQKFLRLGQLQDALLRNARFTVGIKLHTGEFTFDQAVDFFVKEGFQSRTVGTVETKRGTGDPTYLYYTLGKLEILQLRADMQRKLGASFNLQKFHDDFLHEGSPPIPLVRGALLGSGSPVL